MAERYIGIENELISFNGNKVVSFNNYFEKLKEKFKDTYNISTLSIRTDVGNGFYVDGSEIEILTPPVSINKGFSSRLTDSLLIGRNKVLDATPKLKHTGYSMHWNISDNDKDQTYFYNGIAVPFQLFALTPLSNGFNLRTKSGRYELLGDSINNPEQINATALLLGAYSLAIEEHGRFPWEIYNLNRGRNEILVGDGRYDFVEGNFNKLGNKIQVQQYLEGFYHWLKPTIERLGTKKELQNLEEFIFRDKELEFDKFKYFANLYDLSKKIDGKYLPFEDKDNSGTLLKKTNVKKIPLESKLLGEIVKRKKEQIREMNWNALRFNEEEAIIGIENIYKYAQNLMNNNTKFKTASENLKIKNIDEFNPSKSIKYEFDKEKSFNFFNKQLHKIGHFFKDTGKNFGELWSDFWNEFDGGYFVVGGLAVGVGCVLGAILGESADDSKINKEVDKIIQEYKFPQLEKEIPTNTFKADFLKEEIKNGK